MLSIKNAFTLYYNLSYSYGKRSEFRLLFLDSQSHALEIIHHRCREQPREVICIATTAPAMN